jgi:hypothetical protein
MDVTPVDSVEARHIGPPITEERFQRFADTECPTVPVYGRIAEIAHVTGTLMFWGWLWVRNGGDE